MIIMKEAKKLEQALFSPFPLPLGEGGKGEVNENDKNRVRAEG